MRLTGNPVSEGIAIGDVYIYKTFSPEVEKTQISPHEVPQAKIRLQKVKNACRVKLEQLMMQITDEDKAKIFAAHIEILEDEVIFEEVEDEIGNELVSPDYAIYKVFGGHAKIIEKAKDPMIRERAADIIDVRNQMLREWLGIREDGLSSLPGPVIVVADELYPSDTAALDRKNVLGIVTETGGSTSHTAIIAKNYGIPAVLGVQNIMEYLRDGQYIVVDAINGEILSDLPDDRIIHYMEKREAFCKAASELERFLHIGAVSKDGIKAEIGLNIGSADLQTLEMSKHVDMVGLFRTEFLYMDSDVLPDEETQFQVYKRVLQALGDKPVVIRTLDIGGDKTLPAMPLPKEDNPFLGVRALRLCFSKPEVFTTQLRAILRASLFGNLWLMFPMVGSLEDLRRAKQAVDEVKAQLIKEGIPFNDDIKIGIMIEIPSIALIADIVVHEVDFVSIGTNDLCQYTLAADRVNPDVSEYYQSYHPAIFRLIELVVKAFAVENKPVGICGELGGDPLAAPVLFGLGVKELSMNMSSIAKVSKVISGMNFSQMDAIAQKVLSLDTEQAVKEYLSMELTPYF